MVARDDAFDALLGRVIECRGTMAGAPAGLGAFRIDQLIGKGGMGAVFGGTELATGRPVAVKMVHPFLAKEHDYVERFRREARVTAMLDHPHIVRVLHVGDGGGEMVAFLVMERLLGHPLSKALRDGAMPAPRAVRLARQMLSALCAVHSIGVVHRDLKPGNVMVVPDGHGDELVKLVDFGLARLSESEGYARLTRTGQVIGTPRFMAPEQALGDRIDARTDIYGVGATMFTMLTGFPPYPGSTYADVVPQLLNRERPRIDTLVPGLGPLADVVERAMAYDAAARFPSALEMERAVVGFDPDPTSTIRHWQPPADIDTLRVLAKGGSTSGPTDGASSSAPVDSTNDGGAPPDSFADTRRSEPRPPPLGWEPGPREDTREPRPLPPGWEPGPREDTREAASLPPDAGSDSTGRPRAAVVVVAMTLGVSALVGLGVGVWAAVDSSPTQEEVLLPPESALAPVTPLRVDQEIAAPGSDHPQAEESAGAPTDPTEPVEPAATRQPRNGRRGRSRGSAMAQAGMTRPAAEPGAPEPETAEPEAPEPEGVAGHRPLRLSVTQVDVPGYSPTSLRHHLTMRTAAINRCYLTIAADIPAPPYVEVYEVLVAPSGRLIMHGSRHGLPGAVTACLEQHLFGTPWPRPANGERASGEIHVRLVAVP